VGKMKFLNIYLKIVRIFFYAVIFGSYILSVVSLIFTEDFWGFLKGLVFITCCSFFVWFLIIRNIDKIVKKFEDKTKEI
jgi:hypothetical protein